MSQLQAELHEPIISLCQHLACSPRCTPDRQVGADSERSPPEADCLAPTATPANEKRVADFNLTQATMNYSRRPRKGASLEQGLMMAPAAMMSEVASLPTNFLPSRPSRMFALFQATTRSPSSETQTDTCIPVLFLHLLFFVNIVGQHGVTPHTAAALHGRAGG